MISPAFVAMMADYNAEMNRRVYGAAARLPAAARRADGGVFWKSIEGTLSHLVWADEMWLSRFGVGTPPPVGIAASDRYHADFDALAARRVALDAAIRDWAARVTPAELEGDLVWMSGATGREMRKPRAMCVVQIFNHQTHHRGQVHALLTRAGEDTGATDLPFIL
ncbi:MAG: damage-inducible protein DinB [Rhodovulum sulfidophilum]|uniref:Damage-inducible protein DinB n=1 Tax=Rhodovulum sulfidophilum TaxID=35806 RepID=A0A2W5NBB2_RHOSU|nr:MAG: damage-inducible protein DinB [Rhodovulum sulfidophilum]